MHNRKPNSNTASRFKGVCASGSGWVASIRCDNIKYYLGSFRTEEEAARAYDAKARELHRVFALLNFPDPQ